MVVHVPAAEAQQSRTRAFSFLHAAPNARVAGLGGVNVSLADKDPNGFFSNPVLTGDTLAGFASAGYQFYVGDIGQAAFSWSPVIGRAGMVSIGVQHLGYGTISSYDASGNEIGDFTAGETALHLSKQHQIGNYRLGITLKAISSNLAGYRSGALAFDIGGLFIHPHRDFAVGLVIKNAGVVIRDYTGTSDSRLPFDIQIGTTFKPEFMPLRFSLTAYRLTDYEVVSYSGSDPAATRLLDKVFRHFNFGSEILIHRNVNVLLGYNYGIRQELKLENAGGGAGLAFGIAAQIKAVNFVFSRSTWVPASAAYNFTLAVDVDRMLKR